MRKRKTIVTRPAELAAPETRIVFNEVGSSGLQETMGFVQAAYNSQLYWPGVAQTYARIRRSMPEMVMVGNAFATWGRNVKLAVELPDNPSDDDKRYQDFIESEAQNMDGGFGAFLGALLSWVPFYGWGWWEVLPGVRNPEWTPPDGDPWRSEANDNLIGIRRLAYRDATTLDHWQFDDSKRVTAMWQTDLTKAPGSGKPMTVPIPIEKSLHITYGDSANPEGLSPLEAVYRLERIKYGLEVVQGIGFEHAAGYLSVTKTEAGALSSDDRQGVRDAAKAILTAQQGNYALWPYGITGEVKDVSFGAAPSILSAIQNYGVLALSCYSMQWMALSATTGAGSYSAMTDSSSMAVFTFNAMLDSFAAQYDAQVGKKLWAWNKSAFPGATSRPRLYFTHIEKEVALNEMAAFVSAMRDIMPMGDDDFKAIRERAGFLPNTLPEGKEPTAEEKAQQLFDTIQNARRTVDDVS